MPIPADVCELTPSATPSRDDDESTHYWIRGDAVMFRHHPIKGADPATFRFYRGGFAKDRKHCYCNGTRLAGGDGASFRALNYAYATDGQFVWTMGGKVKDADADTFEVCDDGVQENRLGPRLFRIPHGYGKDRARVFYYDFDGKPNWVRKATPASFVSLNDGEFGYDEHYVFCGAATIPKARVQSWRKFGGRESHYSGDGLRVFYGNQAIEGADPGSFEIIPTQSMELARDKDNYYWNGRSVGVVEFNQLLESAGRAAEPSAAADSGRTRGS